MARILVVDDESMVRTVSEGILTRLGHEVVAASDGRTGVEAYRRGRRQIPLQGDTDAAHSDH